MTLQRDSENQSNSQVVAPSVDAHALTERPTTIRPIVARLRAASGDVVPYLHYGAERLGKTGVVGVAIIVFAGFAFLSTNLPLREQVAAQSAQLEELRVAESQSHDASTDATPQMHAGRFVHALPSRNDIPAILTTVLAVATATGLELEQGTYEFVAPDAGGIGRYEMSIPVVGTYPQVRQFVENVLAEEPSVLLDRLTLERPSVADTRVAADLRFSILIGGAE